jgi:hypothetical protein
VTDISVDFKRRGADGKPFVPKAVRELIKLKEAGVVVRRRGRPRLGSDPQIAAVARTARTFRLSDL